VTDDGPVYEPRDVVYGADPFKGSGAARPWMIVSNHEGRPFHGEQYIALTLTTSSWLDGLVEIDPDEWLDGGTPRDSWVVPWGVQSIGRADIERWQGRVGDRVLYAAIDELVDHLRR
jgi:hypothetical protein